MVILKTLSGVSWLYVVCFPMPGHDALSAFSIVRPCAGFVPVTPSGPPVEREGDKNPETSQLLSARRKQTSRTPGISYGPERKNNSDNVEAKFQQFSVGTT